MVAVSFIMTRYMSIIVIKKGKEAKKVEPATLAYEEELRKYILENPHVIPLDELREDIRLFLFAREFPTTSGPIDAIAVDDEGSIYVIETKLYKNPDKRLVVAQVLDYGAALWSSFEDYTDIERIIDDIVSQKFGMTFRQKLKDVFGLDDEQVDDVLNRFQSNLKSGRFIFVVLMDHLHEKLKDLIAFINTSSKFLLLGCEIELYQYEDLEILIPKLYGIETKKVLESSSAKPVSRKQWDESTFFEDVKVKVAPHVEKAIRELYEFAKKTADNITWGTWPPRGSFNPKYKYISERSVFTVFSDGELRINFGWLNDNELTLAFRKDLKDKLTEKTPLTFPADYENKWVTFKPHEWVNHVKDIINVLNDLIQRAQRSV